MSSDRELVQIFDAALVQAARKSGEWLLCRPGCNQCCYGPFEITQLDAQRLREGLTELDQRDAERAARVRQRARKAALGGIGDDDPCPALDPQFGTCDLYTARPITCRAFGPPVRCESGVVGICELCFEGASEDQIRACLVDLDMEGLEAVLIQEVEQATGVRGMTSVAQCLAAGA
ncbi:MAG TPA: YkgJ family cysteine cluster protein [Bryobacteraceae bacterium]|nr:YkgJ family cysteine cluster protein [Bryobacteraceae bacterium]